MKSTRALLLLRVALGLLGASMIASVGAQSAPTQGAAGQTSIPPAPAKVKKQNPQAATALKPVIVTGVLRQQNLQKFAGTVSSLDAEDIRGIGINNSFKKIQVMVPGLNISNQEGNVEIYLRGVGSSNSTELGSPAVAPYLNGNYISRARGLGLFFYDLQNVEVHEGPQGTGSGRNALGGTINIVSKKPELGKLGGYGQIEYGNRNQRGTEAAINIPLTATQAIRLATYTQDIGSDFKNAGIDKRLTPAGVRAEKDARLSYLNKPNDKLSILLVADAGHEGGTGYPGANIYSATQAGFTDPSKLNLRNVVFRGQQGKLDNHIWGFSSNVDYDFGPFTLKYNGAYRSVNFQQTNAEADGIVWPGRNIQPFSSLNPGGEQYDNYGNVYWRTISKAQTHQILLQSPADDRLAWTVGGFYSNERQQSAFASFNDLSAPGACCYTGSEYTMPYVRDKSAAVFADGTFKVTHAFRLLGGIRYTTENLIRRGLGGNLAILPGGVDLAAGNNYACCFAVRIGSPGFFPALLNRPNTDVSGLTTKAQQALFLEQTAATYGSGDNLLQILNGVVDGSKPNGTCVNTPASNGNGNLSCPANGQNSFLNLTTPLAQYGHEADHFIDGRLGFQYDLSDNHMVYTTITTGHKAGGFNDTVKQGVAAITYKPEFLTSYEVGSKNQFEVMGKQSTLNVSGFLYNWRNQVFQSLYTTAFNPDGTAAGYSLLSQNLGESQIYGVSLHDTMLFDHGFLLGVDALFLHTKILRGVVGDPRSQNYGAGGISSTINLAGNQLQYSSKFNLSAHLQQYINLNHGEFDWQVLGMYRSAYYLTNFNQLPVTFLANTQGTIARVESSAQAGFPDRQPGYFQVNLGAGYSPDGDVWRVEAYCSNLFNKTVSQKEIAGSGINIRFLNDARTYGVRLHVNF